MTRFAKYGLTEAQFMFLLDLQNNQCGICQRFFTDARLPCIDHDHETGQVRGILCKNCNSGLGMFKDSVRWLSAAIVYLETSEKIWRKSWLSRAKRNRWGQIKGKQG